MRSQAGSLVAYRRPRGDDNVVGVVVVVVGGGVGVDGVGAADAADHDADGGVAMGEQEVMEGAWSDESCPFNDGGGMGWKKKKEWGNITYLT